MSKDATQSVKHLHQILGEATFDAALLRLQEIKESLLASSSQLHRYTDMPSRAITTHLVESYIQGTPGLFFTWSLPHARALVESVYDEDIHSFPIDLAECHILATGGTNYNEGQVSGSDKAVYCASAIDQFQVSAKTDCLRTMRMMLCLILFLLYEKHSSVQSLLRKTIRHLSFAHMNNTD